MKSIEEQLAEALDSNKKLTAQIKTLEESASATQKAAAQAELGRLVLEAKLPQPAVDRLKKQFENATTVQNMAEAVTAETEYIKSLGGSVRKNLGATDNSTNTNEAEAKARRASLKESLKKSGHNPDIFFDE